MQGDEIFTFIFSLLIGGGGSAGICVFLIRRALEKRLNKYEKEAEEVASLKKQLGDAENRLHHAYGRMFFWIYHALEHSEELEKAFCELEEAEAIRKSVEREIISRFNK